jgi:hypothetical protein
LPPHDYEKYAKISSLGLKYTQLISSQKLKNIIPATFSLLSPDSTGILRGQGGPDLRKKPEVENLVSDSL